jgi:hypothetical protein
VQELIARIGAHPVRGHSRPRRRCGRRRVRATSRRTCKRSVWERDGGQCTFVSESGRRCEGRRNLQFDSREGVRPRRRGDRGQHPAPLPRPQPAHRRADVRRRLHEAEARGSGPPARRAPRSWPGTGRRPRRPRSGRSHACSRTNSRSSPGCFSWAVARSVPIA